MSEGIWRRCSSSTSSAAWRERSNCLICNVGFERKPTAMMMTISGGGGGGEEAELEDDGGRRRTTIAEEEGFIREALRLFWKLLRGDHDPLVVVVTGEGRHDGFEEEEAGGWWWEKGESAAGHHHHLLGSILGPPCCSECGGALVKILELQRLIHQSLVEQKELVKSLKNALASSSSSPVPLPVLDEGDEVLRRPDEDFWERVRRQLGSCVVSNNITSGSGGGDSCEPGGEESCISENDNVDNDFHHDEDVDYYHHPQEDEEDEELESRELEEQEQKPPTEDAWESDDEDDEDDASRPSSSRRGGPKRKRNGGGASQVDLNVRPCSVALERIDPYYNNINMQFGTEEKKLDIDISLRSGMRWRRSKQFREAFNGMRRKSLRGGGSGGSSEAGSSDDNDYDSSEAEDEYETLRPKNAKKKFKADEDDEEFLMSDSEDNSEGGGGGGGDNNTKPDSQPEALLLLSDAESDEEHYSYERKRLQKKLSRSSSKPTNVEHRRQRPKSDNFFLMGSEHLLYQNTPVQFSPQGFTCLEEEEEEEGEGTCFKSFSGTDYSAFQELRHHIVSDHAEEDYSTKPRACVLCSEQFPDGVELKNHLLLDHQPDFKFVCESCWKPVPEEGGLSLLTVSRVAELAQFQAHVWTHKSEEEKQKADDRQKASKNETEETRCRNAVVKPSSSKSKKQKKWKKLFSANPNAKTRRMPKSDAFFLLGNKGEYLLYKNTSIKVSPGVGFICMEDERCSKTVSGTDFNAFQEMRHHVVADHNDIEYPTKPRGCVLCLEQFPDGTFLKNHLLLAHPPEEFRHVCEACWKPVCLSLKVLREHSWTHKSEEEKMAFVESGGRRPVELKKKNCEPKIKVRKIGSAKVKYNKNKTGRKNPKKSSRRSQIRRKRDTGSSSDDEEDGKEVANVNTVEEGPSFLSTGGGGGEAPLLHICDQCGKALKSELLLQLHQETHLPRALRKQYVCDECGLSLLSRGALRSHISRAHRPELQKTQRICPICDRRFHQRDGERWRSHLRSHTNERPFICEECGQGFINKELLKSHYVSHSDVRTFQCEYCEKSYKHRSNWRRHRELSHADKVPAKEDVPERPVFYGPKNAFPCAHCDKVFPFRSHMARHVKQSHHHSDGCGGGASRKSVVNKKVHQRKRKKKNN